MVWRTYVNCCLKHRKREQANGTDQGLDQKGKQIGDSRHTWDHTAEKSVGVKATPNPFNINNTEHGKPVVLLQRKANRKVSLWDCG